MSTASASGAVAARGGLQDIDAEVLGAIFDRLDPTSLCSAGSTCRALRTAAAEPGLWQRFAQQRWHGCRPHLFPLAAPAAPAPHDEVDWKQLYRCNNGLRRLRIASSRIDLPHVANEENWFGVQHIASAPSGDAQIYTSTPYAIERWTLTAAGPMAAPAARLTGRYALAEDAPGVASLHDLPDNVLCSGDIDGSLSFYRLPLPGDCNTDMPLRHRAAQQLQSPVSDLCYLRHSQLLAMRASVAGGPQLPPAGSRFCVKLYDVQADRYTGDIADVLDGYSLQCFCPLSASSAGGAGGSGSVAGGTGSGDGGGSAGDVLVAGSVHAEHCSSCWDSWMQPSLCWHKPRARVAALCFIDTRQPGGIAQRYATQHRSLYSRLRCARCTFIFTSHASQPLCVWDSRFMSAPLFEQDHLPAAPPPWMLQAAMEAEGVAGAGSTEEGGGQAGNGEGWQQGGGGAGSGYEDHEEDEGYDGSESDDVSSGVGSADEALQSILIPAQLPLGCHSLGGRPMSQALWLDATDDLLVGSSDTGAVWLWDLCLTLGWASGSGGGSWTALMEFLSGTGARATAPAGAGGGGSDAGVRGGEFEFVDGPQLLGALSCGYPMSPEIHLLSGSSACDMVANCPSPTDGAPGYLQCMRFVTE